MSSEKRHNDSILSSGDKRFRIEGVVQLEDQTSFPADTTLAAYIFDCGGQILGTADIDTKGGFQISIGLDYPGAIELVIAPADDQPEEVRKSSAFIQRYTPEDWKTEGKEFVLKPKVFLPRDIWWPLLPVRICVTGHVRKVQTIGDRTEVCPVPYVKVEIFDVDREGCWWPYIRRWWEWLWDRRVIRIEELLKDPPRHIKPPVPPGPDPVELVAGIVDPAQYVELNPQPEPPSEIKRIRTGAITTGQLGLAASSAASDTLVGEAAQLASSEAARVDKLTLTSKIAPWIIFKRCFFSKRLVCETTTDNCGYFRCCFKWPMFHFRHGRLRFDPRPDIIVRVTQIIDGVETVIYMDPYTSTRWNVSNAHIDLFLDNPEVQCGPCDDPKRPAGTQVFLTRVGNDEVYLINQANGLYSTVPPISNMAYGNYVGDPLRIFAQFGDTLSRHDPIPGAAAPYYYKLSYSRDGINFTAINATLGDTRVNKATWFSESHKLGPYTIGGVPSLYEIRDFKNYLWYNPDWISAWDTAPIEADTHLYTLRLEVFDANGVKLASTKIDYRDGTVAPPAVLPPMVDHCDLKITVDNKPPDVNFTVPAVLNECGVIPWSAVPPLTFNISVTQENGRLYYWGFQYTKGVNPTVHVLDSGVNNNGSPSSIIKIIDGTAPPNPAESSMLAGITTTCAFALKLWAYSHIRNGYGLVYYREQIKAIAIEKCPPCPPIKSI